MAILTADKLSLGYDNAGFANSIFRGKNLGSSVSQAQWTAISNGTFSDIFVGDYWEINNIKWRVAACDYFLNKGDTQCTTHHVVIVPDSNLLAANGSTTHYMNTTNVTTGGYKGSGFHSGTNPDNTANSAKNDCKTIINAAFGNGHILTHKELITNAVTDGKASGWSWENCDVECMSEVMVYGHNAWGSAPGYETASEMTQLPLFAHKPDLIINRAHWWLRSVAFASDFARVDNNGIANSYAAGSTWVGVRPAFTLCA